MLNSFAGLRQLRTSVLHDRTLRVDKSYFEFYIPKNMLYFEIWLNARDNYTASPNDNVNIIFNNDYTLTNYRTGYHRAAATHTYSGADDSAIGLITSTGSGGSLGTANQAGTLRVHVYDPSNALWFKEAWGSQITRFATNTEIWTRCVVWKNTSPITKVSLVPGVLTNLFLAGSRCTALGYTIQ
jgi:hypothetical protein